MAIKTINDTHLTNIADAIRNKYIESGVDIMDDNGEAPKYKPSEMATAINNLPKGSEIVITALNVTENGTYTAPTGVNGYNPVTVNVPTGGGAGIPSEAFNISGNCSYMFFNKHWDWFIENYGDQITTSNITSANNMFTSSEVKTIPFEFNFDTHGGDCEYMFYATNLESINNIDFKQDTIYKSMTALFSQCHQLKTIGKLSNIYPASTKQMFYGCQKLRELPQFENLNLDRIHTYTYSEASSMFMDCSSLRTISEDFLDQFYGIQTSSSYLHTYQTFYDCYTLDEIIGLNPQTGINRSNIFKNTFNNCHRLKNIIFSKQEDGTPYTTNWKKQTIDLSEYIGYEYNLNNHIRIIGFNSGITMDKEVTDDASYQALKNDPDWFTSNIAYSRYNHDSAVATINSLPDTSAYLAANGGTNTIKFKGESGSATVGGAINTLTEEEIAVAAAKGWTVTLV